MLVFGKKVGEVRARSRRPPYSQTAGNLSLIVQRRSDLDCCAQLNITLRNNSCRFVRAIVASRCRIRQHIILEATFGAFDGTYPEIELLQEFLPIRETGRGVTLSSYFRPIVVLLQRLRAKIRGRSRLFDRDERVVCSVSTWPFGILQALNI